MRGAQVAYRVFEAIGGVAYSPRQPNRCDGHVLNYNVSLCNPSVGWHLSIIIRAAAALWAAEENPLRSTWEAIQRLWHMGARSAGRLADNVARAAVALPVGKSWAGKRLLANLYINEMKVNSGKAQASHHKILAKSAPSEALQIDRSIYKQSRRPLCIISLLSRVSNCEKKIKPVWAFGVPNFLQINRPACSDNRRRYSKTSLRNN